MLLPELRYPGKVKIGLIGHDTGTTRCSLCLKLRTDDDTASVGDGQLTLVFGVTEKAQMLRLCHVQRRQPFNQQLGISLQDTTECLDQGA